MAKTPVPRNLSLFDALVNGFSPEARASIRKRGAPRVAGGFTLRPGTGTPLWNRLVAQAKPLLKRRGEKAQLARLLGVHRQAISEYFSSGTRMPDAERTLLLIEWLEIRKKNQRPG